MSEVKDNFFNIVNPNPALSHQFGVFFFAGGVIPNPIDLRFQKVSGLSAEVELKTIKEGGQNLYSHRVPERISYGNLKLERGFNASLIPSPLTQEFNYAFSQFRFYPSTVIVMLFNESERGITTPIASWTFMNAYPVKWSISELNAESNTVLIDSMELAYSRFQTLRL